MSHVRRFHFYSDDRRVPFTDTVIDYKISETEGYVEFNGYYYVLNEELPKRVFYITTLHEEIPYKGLPYKEENTELSNSHSYRLLEEKYYEVEIYNIQKTNTTNVYSETDKRMSLGSFPIDEQKILFRVLKEFNSFEEFLNASTEHITEGVVADLSCNHLDKLE